MIPVYEIAEKPAEDERVAALREAVESLPQKARTMVVLYYMEGYDVYEVAKLMGVTKGAVCAGLARAREKLRGIYRGGCAMKKAEWRAVYAPRDDMLEKRVRQTLMQLEDKPTHARPKRMVWLAAALILVLAAAAAVAAGWARSTQYDAKRLAHHALEEKYGFTRDMDSFFRCTVEEKGENGRHLQRRRGRWRFCGKLGDYIVTIRDGKAEASWSNDGEAVSDDFSSDVGDTALWRAASSGAKRARNGMKSRERHW